MLRDPVGTVYFDLCMQMPVRNPIAAWVFVCVRFINNSARTIPQSHSHLSIGIFIELFHRLISDLAKAGYNLDQKKKKPPASNEIIYNFFHAKYFFFSSAALREIFQFDGQSNLRRFSKCTSCAPHTLSPSISYWPNAAAFFSRSRSLAEYPKWNALRSTRQPMVMARYWLSGSRQPTTQKTE